MKSYIVIPIEKQDMFYSLAPKFGVKASWSNFSYSNLTDEEYSALVNGTAEGIYPDLAEIEVEYEKAQQLFDLGYQFGTKTQEDIFLKKSQAK
jgi:hypothetical protein